MTVHNETDTAGQAGVRLWNVLDVPARTQECAVVRISDPQAREELGHLQATLQRSLTGSKIGDALSRVGPNVVEDSPEGERERRLAGFVPVRLRDLDPRASRNLLAYVAVLRGVLVLLIPSSAIETNLPPLVGDRTKAPRNGSAELVLEVIVSLPSLNLLAAPRLDRLFRRLDTQGRIMTELREYDVRLWADGSLRDLSNPGTLITTSLEGTTKGDGDANARKSNILSGRINRVSAPNGAMSKRDTNYNSCPIGFGPVWADQPNGARVAVKGSIELNLDWEDTIATGWRLFAAGATYAEMADALMSKYFPLRDGSGRQLRDAEPSARRLQIVRNAFTEKAATLHQSGLWQVERSTGAPIASAAGISLTRRADGRRATTISGALPVHLVAGQPWGTPPEVWEQVFARFDAMRRARPADRGRRKAHMFMGSSRLSWQKDKWTRLQREHTALQLRAMPGTSGERPMWDATASELLASCGFTSAWNQIGAELLIQVGRAGAAATELLASGTADNHATRHAREELERCRARLTEARRAADTAGKLATKAMDNDMLSAAGEHLANQERYLAVVKQEESREPMLSAALTQAAEQAIDEHADLGTPAGVAAALMRWDGRTDEGLRIAVRELGLVESMQARYNQASDSIDIDLSATLALTDGRPVTLPVSVSLPNTSNLRQLGAETPAMIAEWAKGASLDELARHRERTLGWVRTMMRSWLRRHGINTMATALLDCPVLITRQIVIASVDPGTVKMPLRMSDGSRLTRPTVEVISAPYLNDRGGTWKAWAGYEHAPDRRMINVLRIAGGEMDVAPLAVAAGADPARLAVQAGNRPRLADQPRPGRRRLMTCPHSGCDGAPLWHVLYVPETAQFGVVCAKCRRLPDASLADAPLPPEYLTKWEQQHDADRLATIRAPGASLKLPNVAMASLGAGLLRPAAAADILHIAIGTFGDMRQAGKLPAPVSVKGVLMWREDDLVKLAERRAKGFRFGIKDGMLSPAEAATRLGVRESMVRKYLQEGLLPYRKVGTGPKARYRLRAEIVAAFQPPAGDLIRSLSAEEAARDSGVPHWVIRGAMARGELVPALTSSGVRRLLPEVFEDWLQRRAPQLERSKNVPRPDSGMKRLEDGKLSVSAAAVLLALSPKQVRGLADKGVLNDHRSDGTGWRWFDVEEVERYGRERKRHR